MYLLEQMQNNARKLNFDLIFQNILISVLLWQSLTIYFVDLFLVIYNLKVSS